MSDNNQEEQNKTFNIEGLTEEERKDYLKRKSMLIKSLNGIKNLVNTIPTTYCRLTKDNAKEE